ncbi:hypothetical protein A9P82_00065 [Arachidicoccus ginsenosidimutans]|uniref:hypothetical protein n=1 Tax=Arachidicoccus sp. BS20 TaxID=1850526 RepID=UPI0007F0E2E2|nr:hypothetical protein [Arachidicoccus sp. BS20]ANI90522.1 hypothetical protein A9P82_00065 [Arachidicoccus sp. BS20]
MNLFETTLEKIVENDALHAKLLNTLSLMENVGARKISKYEHPVHVSLTVLKHAAEEARHAFYLKKQIGKLDENLCPDYSAEYLLAPIQSHQYLHQLDAKVCRYLYGRGLTGRAMQDAAYILVTYAIEVRADDLYDIYQRVLTKHNSKVNVKSIILEEAGHLEEMTRMLNEFDANWKPIADDVCKIEDELHQQWIKGLVEEVA